MGWERAGFNIKCFVWGWKEQGSNIICITKKVNLSVCYVLLFCVFIAVLNGFFVRAIYHGALTLDLYTLFATFFIISSNNIIIFNI